ncbi:MAG: hemolysin III family protein [Actinomycetota bacterium]
MATWTPHLGSDTAPTDAAPTQLNRLGIDGLPVPRLRGRIHEATAIPFALAGVTAAVQAGPPVHRVAILIFTVSTVAMLTASAAYHCHSHSMEAKLSARRLDHAMIFVAIAGAQAAFWLITAPPVVAIGAIAVVAAIAFGGIHHKLNNLTLTGTSGSWLYIALGWTGVAMVPFLVEAGDATTIAAVLGGGLVYSAGGGVLARRLVDPWPKVFGYHEVWHLMVVCGVVAHFSGLVRLVVTAA